MRDSVRGWLSIRDRADLRQGHEFGQSDASDSGAQNTGLSDFTSEFKTDDESTEEGSGKDEPIDDDSQTGLKDFMG